MIDYFDIATNVDTQLFFANAAPSGSAITSGSWQTWTKPRNASFVFITAFGSGGGGGGAFSSGSLLTPGVFNGGGGGGASAFSKAIYPASLIPDILYIRVAAGGPGAPGGNNNRIGQSGSLSYICVFPTSSYLDTDIRDANILLVSGDRAAGGGIAGTLASGGNGGSGGTAATLTRPLQSLGIVQSYDGTTGAIGGTGADGGNITIRNLTSGGSGGAGGLNGTSLLGGQILSQSIVPNIVGTNATSRDGFAATQPNTAVSQRYPMIFTGGTGGGSSDARGVAGANGAIGSGGGGAAPFNISGSNPAGGNGGNGLVIITCF
jgi:hypothetical protein